jgi:hypothetical protein
MNQMNTNEKASTLEREIARLYKQGDKPANYVVSTITEVMMILYLANKHKIKDPSQDEIREKYKEYGKLSKRMRSKTEPPEYTTWELNIKYGEKNRLKSDNHERFFGSFYWKLKRIIQANPHKKVICPLNIGMSFSDGSDIGHLEMVMYDPALNTLEHVDSNNIPKQHLRKDPSYFECCRISEEVVRRVAETLPQRPVYINNNDIYTGYEWGIQSLECASDKVVGGESEGYCLMWAALLGDLAMTFPEYSAKDIIYAIMKKAALKQTKVDCMNDYLLYLVRGYVWDISKELNVSFDNEEQQHDVCVRLSRGY